MPELPEVETTRNGIAPHIEGKIVRDAFIRNPNLRWPIPSDLIDNIKGKKLLSVSRRGKYLILYFKHGTALWHLGMSGNLRIVDANTAPGKHDHVDWVFNQKCCLRFNDPRRFGSLLWTEEDPLDHKLLKSLGPEPLSEDFNTDYLFKASRKKNKALKTWVMDSKVVVGVGNIYANEALFYSGLNPLKTTGTITKKQCNVLCENIKQVLSAAIEQGGTTLKDFVGGDGKPGYFAQKLVVYGRGEQPCINCQKPLSEFRINQRATVFCSTCQKK